MKAGEGNGEEAGWGGEREEGRVLQQFVSSFHETWEGVFFHFLLFYREILPQGHFRSKVKYVDLSFCPHVPGCQPASSSNTAYVSEAGSFHLNCLHAFIMVKCCEEMTFTLHFLFVSLVDQRWFLLGWLGRRKRLEQRRRGVRVGFIYVWI